ncbi:UNVERIFIED_CONTAM: hypothetical protein FKN15_017482 [Acipenser sinensis]
MPPPVRPPHQRQRWTACLPVANLRSLPPGAPGGLTGQVAPNVHAVTLRPPFLGGKQLPRALPSALSPPLAWNGDYFFLRGEEDKRETEKDEEDSEDGFLACSGPRQEEHCPQEADWPCMHASKG